MRIFTDKAGTPLVTSGLVYTQSESGPVLSLVPLESALRNALNDPEVIAAGITSADQLVAYQVTSYEAAMAIVEVWGGRKTGSLLITATEVSPNPAWQPPAPPVDRLADLVAKVDAATEQVNGNILASPHDKRWLAQKNEAKSEGIAWVKAHPASTQTEAETAINAIIAAAFPAEPRVVSGGGLIVSYAVEAQARGIIAAATYEALRDFMVATPDKQLQKLLAKL